MWSLVGVFLMDAVFYFFKGTNLITHGKVKPCELSGEQQPSVQTWKPIYLHACLHVLVLST